MAFSVCSSKLVIGLLLLSSTFQHGDAGVKLDYKSRLLDLLMTGGPALLTLIHRGMGPLGGKTDPVLAKEAFNIANVFAPQVTSVVNNILVTTPSAVSSSPISFDPTNVVKSLLTCKAFVIVTLAVGWAVYNKLVLEEMSYKIQEKARDLKNTQDASRIANKLSQARFKLDNVEFKLRGLQLSDKINFRLLSGLNKMTEEAKADLDVASKLIGMRFQHLHFEKLDAQKMVDDSKWGYRTNLGLGFMAAGGSVFMVLTGGGAIVIPAILGASSMFSWHSAYEHSNNHAEAREQVKEYGKLMEENQKQLQELEALETQWTLIKTELDNLLNSQRINFFHALLLPTFLLVFFYLSKMKMRSRILESGLHRLVIAIMISYAIARMEEEAIVFYLSFFGW